MIQQKKSEETEAAPVVVEVTVHCLEGPQFNVKGPQKALLDWGVGIKYVKQE